MQSFCQVNFLKTLLALSLLGFLLHPGRFAVLQYQLLHPLPVWPRCFIFIIIIIIIFFSIAYFWSTCTEHTAEQPDYLR